MKNKPHADLKPSLIDLEADNTATGGKQELFSSVQPERLSEKDDMYVLYWIRKKEHTNLLKQGYIGITINFKERMRSHKKNKRKTALKDAINSYKWENLVKEILLTNLTFQDALFLEEKLRPKINIGWNLKKGGEIGVLKNWYLNEENKIKHSLNTSIKTKENIALKDSKEKRSARAFKALAEHKESYKDCNLGSNNGKAILNENQVSKIKCELIPKGLSNKEIAELYGVKHYVIQFIRTNKNWKHVVCDSPDYK